MQATLQILHHSLLVFVDVKLLGNFDFQLIQLEFVGARNVLNLDQMCFAKLTQILLMLLDKTPDFLGVALVDLRSHLLPDEVVEVLDFFENSALQLRFCARALSQLIIALMLLT